MRFLRKTRFKRHFFGQGAEHEALSICKEKEHGINLNTI